MSWDATFIRLDRAVARVLDRVAARLAGEADGGIDRRPGTVTIEFDDGLAREFGTDAAPARPFLQPALDTARRQLAAEIGEALRDGS